MQEKKRTVIADVIDIIKTVAIAAIFSYLLITYVIANAEVPSESMEPTIEKNSNFVLDKISYKFREPKRGDIVVFYAPDLVNTLYVKRLIGMSGETVEGKDGYVYINGEKLNETYLVGVTTTDFGPYTVPEGGYFMLGDNREHSHDARYWENTYIYDKDIIGKALLEYRPSLRIFSNITY